jgi:hypothetical protein
MKPQQPDPKKPAIAVDTLLQGDLDIDEEISDDEANEEIDFPDETADGARNATGVTPAPVADDTTPSVRSAVNKAADMMRQLRGDK